MDPKLREKRQSIKREERKCKNKTKKAKKIKNQNYIKKRNS